LSVLDLKEGRTNLEIMWCPHCPMQAYKIMHGLWGMGQMMFTKYIVVG
jgi:3-polyprenyl-4-hydroxybenzoate decarboxylase